MKTIFKLLLPLCIFIGCKKDKDSDYANNPNAPDYLHNRAVGASANELLSSAKYTSVKIEVQYMSGYQPDAAALNHLQSVLSSVVNKPSGVSIVLKEIPASSHAALSINDVIQIERDNRTIFTSGSELALYVLYTNGGSTDANVIGQAYKNTSMVLYGKTIGDNSGGLGQANRTKLVATVGEHEMGHLLGLVDLGSSMQTNHKDAAHGNHCNNSDCLMYYTSETSSVIGFLITGNIPSFDASCLADLHANGGK